MNYEIVGKLIFKEETQHISDRFQKREFVIEVENEKNSQWNDFVKVQLIQDRCDLLENKIGRASCRERVSSPV